MNGRLRDSWEALRYGPLLRGASTHPLAGRLYEKLVAGIEWRADPNRRAVASARIADTLQCSQQQAQAIFRACLGSEAREEADTAWVARRGIALADILPHRPGLPSEGRGSIFATLHLGSPILTFLYLREVLGLPLRAIGRPLDDDNPLSAAKRAWGSAKVGWVSRSSGTTFINTDARGIIQAREELLAGRSIYAAIDVPADLASRAMALEIHGRSFSFAAGIPRLAQLTGAEILPVIGLHRAEGFRVEFGAPISCPTQEETQKALAAWLSQTLCSYPDEWWLWPYAEEVAK
ncbi:MAG: hypothetical protein VCC00_12605 [Deltaproteobacteria bacterium]